MSKPDIDDNGLDALDLLCNEVRLASTLYDTGKITHSDFVDKVSDKKAATLQAIYSLLASEAVSVVKPDGSITFAITLGKLAELLGVAE